MRLGPWEIGLILVIVLIIFGAGRIANLGKDLGKAIRGFREASKGDEEAKKEEEAEETVKTAATTKKKTKDSAKEA
jgi:sec-independent protein translocase protein TatA